MRSRRFRAAVALAGALVASSLVLTGTSAQGDAPMGTLSIARFTELTPIWHPVGHGTGQQSLVMAAVFDTLVKTGSDSREIKPGLADSWEASEDATTFTFNLNPDATWHDGQPVTADDVVFTATWSAQNADKAHGWLPQWPYIAGAADILGTTDPLSGIEAVDDHTVRITLAAPNAEFLRGLTNASNSIVPKHLLEGIPGDQMEQSEFATTSPIGSGPFRYVGYENGQYVELAANTDYFRGAPKVEKVFIRLLAPEAVLAQLESGELDIGFRVSPLEAERLSQNPDLQVIQAQDPGADRFFLNTNEGHPFASKELRQAFYYALDRQAMLDGILGGRGTVLNNPPGFAVYDDLTNYSYDPDKARELITASGWDVATPIRITYNQEVAAYPTIMPLIQQFLEDAGLKVELMPLDASAWVALITDPARRGEWDAYLQFGGSEFLSPDETSIYFDCNRADFNTGFQDCSLTDAWAAGRSTTDPAARDEAYHHIAKVLNEEAPLVYLWQGELTTVVNKRVQGFTPHVQDRESLMDVLDISAQ